MYFDDDDDLYLDGDPRRCPRHPSVATSSPDGMYDGLCPYCESEMEAEEPDAAPQPAPPSPSPSEVFSDDDDIPF